MTVSDAAWERIRANPSAPRGSFLSMLDWKEQWIDGEKFPFTPSVSDLHGVEAACDELLEEGLEASIARHERSAARLPRRRARDGARALAAQRGDRGRVRDGDRGARRARRTSQVRAHCRERYGVMISGGQGAGNLVRIGHMGPTARSLHPVVGLAALGRTLADLGAQARDRRRRRGGADRALAGEAGRRVTTATSSQPAPGYADVTVERNVECRLPDGVVLRADVYRPAAEVSLPVLLMRMPYGKTTAEPTGATRTRPGTRAAATWSPSRTCADATPPTASSRPSCTRLATATTRWNGRQACTGRTARSACTASRTRARRNSWPRWRSRRASPRLLRASRPRSSTTAGPTREAPSRSRR